jgi:cytochrome c-type biogenesis protein CcmE
VRRGPGAVRRGRTLVAVALLAAGLGWVAVRGLSGNLVYYQTPSDLAGRSVAGERLRLGGYVLPGSVQRAGSSVHFVVTDGAARTSVAGSGGVPSLFKAGQGVVVEGVLGGDGVFHADTVLVKHSSEYRPPAPGETPGPAELEAGG